MEEAEETKATEEEPKWHYGYPNPSQYERWRWDLPYIDDVDVHVFGDPKRLLLKGPAGADNHFLTIRPPTAEETELLSQIEQTEGSFRHLDEALSFFEKEPRWVSGIALGDIAIWASRQPNRQRDVEPIGPKGALYDRRVVQQAIQPMLERRAPGIWVAMSEIELADGSALRFSSGDIQSIAMCCLPDKEPKTNPDHLVL